MNNKEKIEGRYIEHFDTKTKKYRYIDIINLERRVKVLEDIYEVTP